MSRYAGSVAGITPATANDNWALDTTSTSVGGSVLEVSWGGEVTTSTAMRTRIARASTQGTTTTAGNVQKIHSRAPTNTIVFATSAWTTQPTLSAGGLFETSWNAHGGVVRWLAAPGEEFIIIGSAGISCRNGTGKLDRLCPFAR